MYYSDYHTHTLLSPDSDTPLPLMAQTALDMGLSEICVTDHYDTLEPMGDRSAPFEWAPAVAQIRENQAQFAGKLVIKLGLELGSGHLDRSVLVSAPDALDFVLGSIHNRSEAAGGMDFFYDVPEDAYQTEKGCYTALDDYVSSLEALAPLPVYDVMAHLIYPLRYMQPKCPAVTMDRYAGRIRDLLATVIRSGRGMELNTYRGRTLAEWAPWLRMYRELGGEIVTVGSDAHRPNGMGQGIREAYELLTQCGFRYVCTYDRRKPTFQKL
ncbi:MAG: PHP domain-containing protein [Intestinimonas sp.]|jgi:histidinol-phosphatase (PHP family)|nr:PHP domain-containing protein [Intestinimonas sp.]